MSDNLMRVKSLRNACDMTQQELANSMGVTQACVGMWEIEQSLPRTRQLPLLAKVLGCTIDDLFEDSSLPASV